MSSLVRRVTSGIGGQAYARAAIILNTLAMIPVLLRFWGLETYGEWLALTSLASYLTLSNFGLSSAACMSMIRAVSEDAVPEAARTFQVSLNILIAVVLPIGMLLIWVTSALPLRNLLKIVTISQPAVMTILSLLLVQIIAMTVKGLYAGAINASGRYGAPNYVSGTIKMIELSAIVGAVAFCHVMPVAAALISAVAGILDLGVHVGLARYTSPWARIRLGAFDKVLFRKLIGPSVGHATIYVAVNSVVVQGPRIALSATLGPTAVAVFGVYSTLVRSMEHITNLIAPVLQLEFARNSGTRDGAVSSRQMVIHGSRFAVASFLAGAGLIALSSPFVIPIWTGHKMAFDGDLLAILLATSFFTQLGRSGLAYLMGHNAVLRAAFVMLMLGLCGLGIGSTLTSFLDVSGMGLGFLVTEAVTTSCLIVFVAQGIGTSLLPFVRDQFDLFTAAKEIRGSLRRNPLR